MPQQECPHCGASAKQLFYGAERKLKCPNCKVIDLGAEPCSTSDFSVSGEPISPDWEASVSSNSETDDGEVSSATASSGPSTTTSVPYTNGYTNGHAVDSEPRAPCSLEAWRGTLLTVGLRALREQDAYKNRACPAEELLEPLTADIRLGVDVIAAYGIVAPRELTPQDILDECERCARLCIEEWCNYPIVKDKPAQLPAVKAPEPRRSSLIVETYEIAEASNAAYLMRPAVIERLGYSQSIMLVIGGKHHGKSTVIRTLAMSIQRSLPVLGRTTTGGPVIYAVSGDEVAATRHELLEMGWREGRDNLILTHKEPSSEASAEETLGELGEMAKAQGAVTIILDMLFDYCGITDELSYAQTRGAIGHVQVLADETKCLVIGSHHTPKYLADIHTAENAALGSQGISARFSPIVLVRKWTDTCFSVDSTMTRDPRGQALAPLRIFRNEQGWIETTGDFKGWMKWQMYADRTMAIFEGGDRNEHQTVTSVAQQLGIDRAQAQNCLYQLTQTDPPQLKREKHARSYRYYLASADMFERKGGHFGPADD